MLRADPLVVRRRVMSDWPKPQAAPPAGTPRGFPPGPKHTMRCGVDPPLAPGEQQAEMPDSVKAARRQSIGAEMARLRPGASTSINMVTGRIQMARALKALWERRGGNAHG